MAPERPRQVCHHHHSTTEYADQQDVFAGIVSLDLHGHGR